MTDSETLDLVWNLSGIIAILSFVTAITIDHYNEFYRKKWIERILLTLSKIFWFIGKVAGIFWLILVFARIFIAIVLRVFS